MRSIRKRLGLLGVVVSLAAIAMLGLAVSVTEGHDDEGDDDDTLVLNVDVDESSFDGPDLGFTGAFNVEGDTGDGAGSFQCWGWQLADGSTNVSQVYNIEGGAIMTQGQEGGFLAIVGGTGEFSEAEGEAFVEFTGPGFDFTITFELDD